MRTAPALVPSIREVAPLAVDPAAVRALATELLAASAQVDDLGSFVAGRAPLADWRGAAAAAYHAAIRPLGRRADAMSLALRQVAHRAEAHAEALAGLLDRREHLLAEGATLRRLVEATGEAAVLAPRVERYDADLAVWEREVAAECAAMTDAFARTTTTTDVRRWAGVADPADVALDRLPAPGASPQTAHDWWTALPAAARAAVVVVAPAAIGNLAGLPAAARSRANRVALARDLADWSRLGPAVRTTAEARGLAQARATRRALTGLAEEVDARSGEPVGAALLAYDPGAFEGDGRVAVAVGDPDTASHVAVVVPGLGTDAGSAPYQAERALTLQEATRHLHDESVATVAWIGYDAPDNLRGDHDWAGVVREGHAVAGGERLAAAVTGLVESRPDDPAHVTVVGHSYGSTTTAHAATDHGLRADDVVLVGSPGAGAGADHAVDLGVGAGHVWVGAASGDLVTGLADNGWVGGATLAGAGLGADPAEDDFGAQRFRAEPVAADTTWDPFAEHRGYFDHGSESLANIGHVVAADHDDVRLAGHRHDPWWAGPQDPEEGRVPDPVTTRSR